MKNDYSFILDYLIPLENWKLVDVLDDSHFFLDSFSGVLCACVVAPHKGTDYNWMLRVANIEGFDRWGYAQIENFYENPLDLVKFLEDIDTKVKLIDE